MSMLFVLTVGCQGVILPPTGPVTPVGEPPPPEVTAPTFFPSETATLTAPRLFRLTQEQLRFALEDIFATTLTETQIDKLGRDADALGYTNNAAVLDLQSSNAASMYELFRELAQKSTTKLNGLSSCLTAVAPTDACVRTFIKTLGLKVFRQPVTQAQEDRYAALYTSIKADGASVAVAVQYVIEALLRSPSFFYREEIGTIDSDSRVLTGSELAAALAATLTRRGPDAELTAKAADGSLLNPDELQRQARRLLDLHATQLTTVEFFKEWLRIKQLMDIEKDTSVFPQFNNALKAAMLDETSSVIMNELSNPGASLKELMTTSTTYVKQPLDTVYGLAGMSNTMAEVQLDPAQRAGLLTQPSLMTALADQTDSHPIRRGLFVLTRALCQSTPALPRNVNISLPDLQPGETKRQRFQRHSSDPSCSACHRLIDPFGFGLESFDGEGAFRTTEQGTPIDVSADIQFLPYSKAQTNTGADLSRFLAGAPEFHACFVRQMFRYTMGRQETEGDDPLLRAAYTHFTQQKFNIKELQLFLVTSNTFTHRSL